MIKSVDIAEGEVGEEGHTNLSDPPKGSDWKRVKTKSFQTIIPHNLQCKDLYTASISHHVMI